MARYLDGSDELFEMHNRFMLRVARALDSSEKVVEKYKYQVWSDTKRRARHEQFLKNLMLVIFLNKQYFKHQILQW